jgi:hypothetical protein
MVCLRDICIDTLHKGDSIFTYNNNNNNNNVYNLTAMNSGPTSTNRSLAALRLTGKFIEGSKAMEKPYTDMNMTMDISSRQNRPAYLCLLTVLARFALTVRFNGTPVAGTRRILLSTAPGAFATPQFHLFQRIHFHRT